MLVARMLPYRSRNVFARLNLEDCPLTDLRLSPQEQAVFDLFLKKPERTLVALRAIYTQDLPASPNHCLTSILRSLTRKLAAAKRGRIERVSHRGRGHVGRYRYYRR